MIRSGTTPRAFTWRGGLTVLGLIALLPLLPAWVRAQPPDAEKQLLEVRKLLESRYEVLRAQAASPEAEKARAELKALEAEIARKQAEVKVLEQKLKAAQEQSRIVEAPRAVVPAQTDRVRMWKVVPGEKGGFWQDKPINLLQAVPHKGTLYELVPGEKGTLILRPVPQTPIAPPKAEGPVRFRIEGIERPVIVTPATPATPSNPYVPARSDGRARDLEKRLDDIMKELEQLRKEIKSPKPQGQGKLDQGQPFFLELRVQDQKAEEVKEAEAAVIQAANVLQQLRSVARVGSPLVAEAEARLAVAEANLARMKALKAFEERKATPKPGATPTNPARP